MKLDVDPLHRFARCSFSTGAMVAHQSLERGYSVIRVDSFDNPDLAAMVASNCRTDYVHFFTFETSPDLSYESSLSLLMKKINDTRLKVTAVIAGAETGVERCASGPTLLCP